MDFGYTEEDLAIKSMAAEFARNQLWPNAPLWDEQHHFPVEVLRAAAQLGMAGIYANEDIGGVALSRLHAAMIFKKLAEGCISTSAYLSIHNMVTGIIDKYAPEDLRRQLGPELTSMQKFASYCLTEPDAGSDAAALKTTALREGDNYILNGSKAFISGGGVSDIYLCMVRTGDEGWRGISALVVAMDTPGLSFGAPEKKMGWRSQPTTMVYFENCPVPITNLIGQEGDGFKIALEALNGGRINIASCSLGGAARLLQIVKDYMQERKQFGKPLAAMQGLRFYYADMLSQYEAAKLLVYRAATALDNQEPDIALYAAMAKRFASDAAFAISDRAMQLLGGYGYLHDYHAERIFRDLRVHRILEGTNEIMNEIIAKTVFDKE